MKLTDVCLSKQIYVKHVTYTAAKKQHNAIICMLMYFDIRSVIYKSVQKKNRRINVMSFICLGIKLKMQLYV